MQRSSNKIGTLAAALAKGASRDRQSGKVAHRHPSSRHVPARGSIQVPPLRVAFQPPDLESASGSTRLPPCKRPRLACSDRAYLRLTTTLRIRRGMGSVGLGRYVSSAKPMPRTEMGAALTYARRYGPVHPGWDCRRGRSDAPDLHAANGQPI